MMPLTKYFLTITIFITLTAKNVMAMEMENKDIAVLGALNKITGKNTSIEVDVNSETTFGDLNIKVLSCQNSSPLETPESASYLKIKDSKAKLFSGWMYASSPSISALDNGVYDIWVINCKDK